ncbi:MAG: polyribonucleotide nucleotidyltransferase [Oscillospiraceae bacterium]|nr:polyribonucleotide nucleotidyltransferase [Oscillospiraceae bacterium]
MKNKVKIFKTTFAGRDLSVEIGKTCELSNGSCWITYGETVVMANITASKFPRESIDFFPLSVDYEEKLYSVGKIPGSFMKREGRPSEKAILTSRVIDRSIRPLFPQDMRNDVSLVITVLSSDIENSPETAAMIAASIAISISDIPFNGPIGGVNIGLVNNEIIINPNKKQRKKSDLALTVAATFDKIVMIEAGANQVEDKIMMDAIKQGHIDIKKIVEFISNIQSEVGKAKFDFKKISIPELLFEKIKDFATDEIKFALDTDDKNIREERLTPIITKIHEKFDNTLEENIDINIIDECIYYLQKNIVRRWLLDDKKRVDGRQMDEMRDLSAEVSLLPRVHGSGIFKRGQTQVLSIATLAGIKEAQIIDGIDEDELKRYMHHYNFPSYSVGETKPSRGPGRREIGHGALAEKALDAVIPSENDFPYAIRIVSEVLSSNGSTSQGAICGSTLALMDAGVPIKNPVAGISCGLITEDDKWMTMIDIQGLEDFFGDMDFKVAGTHKGITAIQVDIKIDGLTYEMIEEAFEKTRKARIHIIDNVMLKSIPTYRKDVSEYAPKLSTININPDKIRDVIGAGGKIIQKICSDNNVKIDINDNGKVSVMGIIKKDVDIAVEYIKSITMTPEIGEIYKGKVVRILNFGAFIQIAPGKDGLLHISKISTERVEKVEDVLSIGDEIMVKITEIDRQGRINLSKKDADEELSSTEN